MPVKKKIKKIASPTKKQLKAAMHEHHTVEPSWTGPTPGAGTDRLQYWLCNVDNKCVPTTAPVASDFTENINWRIFRIMAEFVEGFEFLAKLKKEVTVFGSARASAGSKYYNLAKELATKLGKEGYTIITGGGPGLMEAANWGAFEAGAESVGLDISLPMEQRRNQYVKKAMGFRYFFTRKVMLSASAQAYVFMPGGFGTLDELFEMAVLIQTGKMSDKVPIILVGRSFWEPMVKWIKKTMWDELRFIEKSDVELLQIVDTAEEAYRIIKKTPERTL
jgi:uncharacterized protein (TIGR00730 family)